jgi:uncharacterized membrane protein
VKRAADLLACFIAAGLLWDLIDRWRAHLWPLASGDWIAFCAFWLLCGLAIGGLLRYAHRKEAQPPPPTPPTVVS